MHFMSKVRISNKQKTVIVCLRMMGASGRDLLTGIFSYIKRGVHWNLRLLQMPDMLTPAVIDAALQEGVDGIIVSEPWITAETAAALTRTPIPICVLSVPVDCLKHRKKPTAYVANDERATGDAGARFFKALGDFKSLAFVKTFEGLPWCDLRTEGFSAAAGEKCLVFQSPMPLNLHVNGSSIDRKALEQWIQSLPKPAAIMADWDYRAAQVIEICRHLRIKMPEQVAVLGIDNDLLLCETSSPTLSSVKPDHEQVGYRAAAELDRMMKTKVNRSPRTILCPISGIIERKSTKPTTPAKALISKAMDYIDKHACEGATVSDVVKDMGVSRSLADLRFREIRGQSILEELTNRRLAEVTRLLFATDYSIKRISLTCGFTNMKHLKWLFKRHKGMSMREYRATNGGQ